MMTLKLLEQNALDPARGDMVLFNNTGAEAPATYAFARRIAARVEAAQIPFLCAEFATAEVEHHGRWIRTPTYRLVNQRPRTAANFDGFDRHGTPFEELISWSGYTPSQWNRTCTAELKLRTTTRLLDDWLSAVPGPPAIGHQAPHSRIDPDDAWARHQRAGGRRSREAFLRTRAFAWQQPGHRAAQRFAEFSESADTYASAQGRAHNAATASRTNATRGYVSLIGLRADEPRRIAVVQNRAGLARNDWTLPDGDSIDEYTVFPLDDAHITRDDVDAYWRGQPDDLEIPSDVALSNCVYCFLKGTRALRAVHAHIEGSAALHPELETPRAGTPCDWRWWAALEARYGRDLDPPAHDEPTLPPTALDDGSVCYATVLDATRGRIAHVANIDDIPCDCTD